jgi:SNF2 family DNA or RNA helicase
MEAKLHPYQEYCVEWVKGHPQCALLLDMGLGKSLCVLTALADEKAVEGRCGKVLVIAPLAVAKYTWPAELRKWDHLAGLRFSCVLGSAPARREALKAEADLYIINRENVVWLVKECGKKWPFDTVVIDELSGFKAPGAKRFRALRAVRAGIRRVIGLTGTPAPNSLIDLWPQMYLLDQGVRLEKYVTKYRQKYFTPATCSGYTVYSWALRPGAADEIYQRVSDIAVSMRAKDRLSLPGRVTNVVSVRMSAAETALYRKMKREQVLQVEGGTVTAGNAAVLAGKLLQMANGAVYGSGDERVVHIHSAKLEALERLILDAQGEPVLVFYLYRHDLERIQARVPNARAMQAGDVDRWNRREIPVLLAHPQSAGHGLNLQAGGHIIVWFGLPWSLEQYQQANARLDRQGQTETVVVHHLVTEETIDGRVLDVLQGKAAGQEALLEAVKAELEMGGKHDKD